ncbi:hypothetical protein C0992_007417 [Termitomyces sp. T32_za158]|nr:hypothetical protein C0992_007417 [Termitomyces sp. T32_za158]
MLVVDGTAQGRVPDELQRVIFETAGRDNSVARQLILVSRNVRTWIEPILYECIKIRSQQHAEAFFKTIAVRPQGFFGPIVTSLAIGDSVTLQQSKAILAACSQNLVNFAVYTNARNPSIFLPFVRSHSVRQLSLKSTHCAELSFPPALLASLSHLMILDGPYSWFQMREAVRNAKNAIKSGCPSTTAHSFLSLTHFATCSQNWGSTQPLLKLAAKLRYFVVVVPPCSKAAPVIAQRILEIGDRRMVLVEYSPTIENWESSMRGSMPSVWERAEKLVEDGYFAENVDVRKWNL